MVTYLTIITTVMVITQIIRVLQNWRQLRNYRDAESNYNLQVRVFKKLEEALDEMKEKGE